MVHPRILCVTYTFCRDHSTVHVGERCPAFSSVSFLNLSMWNNRTSTSGSPLNFCSKSNREWTKDRGLCDIDVKIATMFMNIHKNFKEVSDLMNFFQSFDSLYQVCYNWSVGSTVEVCVE